MPGRYTDVLALYGAWLGMGLVMGVAVPLLWLVPGIRWPVNGATYVLVGVVFGAQGVLLFSSPERYVGRTVLPLPLRRGTLDDEVDVYLFATVALFLGVTFAYLGGQLLWL